MRQAELGTGRRARPSRARPDYHEFPFWLGIACLDLGEIKPARAHLTLAMQNSTPRRDHDWHAARLARISELH